MEANRISALKCWRKKKALMENIIKKIDCLKNEITQVNLKATNYEEFKNRIIMDMEDIKRKCHYKKLENDRLKAQYQSIQQAYLFSISIHK